MPNGSLMKFESIAECSLLQNAPIEASIQASMAHPVNHLHVCVSLFLAR